MPHTCSRCQRVNPVDAVYCYFDGAILGGGNGASGGPVNIGQQPFPNQFVFPTGASCRNFDQLALTCQQNWKEAVEVLQKGFLESFLGGMGRIDLAQAAKEAAKFPDQDRGLDQFLAKIPSDVLKPPKLFVEPTEVNLGQVKAGEDRKFELHLANQGMRLVYGSVACEDSPFLAVGDGQGSQQKLFQFGADLMIPVHVRGKYLRASNKPIAGKMVVDTNAGKIEVLVKAEIPVKPYPDGIFAGAKSPRQVAEKAKANPKEAAPLFENGTVAKWYKDNGWTYPVQGPAANGLAAVQQFFEALGLTPPPKVEISDKAITLRGDVGGRCSHTIEVKTQEKRPVYAHATCDQSWLEPKRPQLNGRTAQIQLVINKIPDQPGQTLKAKLTVKANGNQRFVLPVNLEIGGTARPGAITSSAPAPAGGGGAFSFEAPAAGGGGSSGGAAAAPVITLARRQQGGGAKLLPAAALLLALVGVLGYDLVFLKSGGDDKGGGDKPTFAATKGGNEGGRIDYDPEPRIGISFRDDNQRFGLVMLKERDPQNRDEFKKLTFSKDGTTNNTCIWLDGQENLFGQQPGTWARDPKNRSKGKFWKGIENPKGRKWVSTWKFTENVYVTQTVMLVPNDDTRLLDTILIHYLVENEDRTPHKVGLRVMLDTYIGAEDGVPFAIPGQSDLLTTKRDFRDFKDIPDFIQALERPNLSDPGTTATMILKLPTDVKINPEDPELSPITRMVICRWPGNPEERWDFTKTKFWDMNDKAQGDKNDSCVTLYWEAQNMGPGNKRAMAFTYGLGKISGIDGDKNAQLALTYAPKPPPGGQFTITAWVKNPSQGQKVKLALPDGMTLAEDNLELSVAKGSTDLSQVSWKVKVDKDAKLGKYGVKATTTGAQAKVDVSVVKKGGGSIFD